MHIPFLCFVLKNRFSSLRKIFLFISVPLLFACTKPGLFELMPSGKTGITFNNAVAESDSLNIINYEYIYNGAGTGIADLNNDGLSDIVFAGNQVLPRVYINEGKMRFRDITANLKGLRKQWYSSVQIADINSDGWLDIYLTSTNGKTPEDCKNRLFINGGAAKGNDPVFTEMADSYGIADTCQTTNAAFLDYDLDGNLDLYILNNTVTARMESNYMEKITDGSAPNNDRLYHNNGDGTFSDVTKTAGIVYEGYGLGLAVGDVNKDGYPDIYVSNDFMSNDLLYINQGNGTFKNEIAKYLSYQSKSSMGDDMADINNDGNPDIFTLDMMPETYEKKKQSINGFGYIFYINDAKYGYEHQYLRNMMQLHNGFIDGKMLPYSEAGQMMGISATDWSWSALFADYDNDGDKDLIVTNGFPKDMTDKDWTRLKAQAAGFYGSDKTLIDMVPAQKIPNDAFENTGSFSFVKRNDWLPDVPSFSYGAAFSDLDNDGDLDYVINNINDEAFILKNSTVERGKKNAGFLKIKLKGTRGNTLALGAKVELWSGGEFQFAEHFLTRGYASSVDPDIHFGLRSNSIVDSVRITWPATGRITVLSHIEPNQTIEIDENTAAQKAKVRTFPDKNYIFINSDKPFPYTHEQNDFVDYALYQKLIPHKFSQIGPRMAKGDLNNDHVEDIIIGATNKLPTSVFLRTGKKFWKAQIEGLTTRKEFSEADLAIVDIDNDGDNDVISVAGGYDNQFQEEYRHYMYINEKGRFIKKSLPVPAFSASVIRPFDYNHDGRTDLFIGARIKNNMYPYSTYSYLIRNQGELVVDSASKLDLGMVTDAVWTDYDNDGWEDLLVAREWNSLALLRNDNGKRLVIQNIPEFENYPGIWFSVATGDFDNDGDIDFIAGNLGENTRFHVSQRFPMNMYVTDFEMDGVIDPVISAYWPDRNGIMTEYPVNYLDELWSQSVYFKKIFRNYTTFSTAGIDMIFTADMMERLDAKLTVSTASSYFVRNEGGKFTFEKLPAEIQLSPLKKMIIEDINDDGYIDVITGGNDYSYEVPTGYFDSNKGLILLNNGTTVKSDKGQFRVLQPSQSGLLLQGMVESLVYLKGDTSLIVAGFNRASPSVYILNKKQLK